MATGVMVVDPTSRTVLNNDTASSSATVSSVTIAGSTATLGVSISGITTTTPMPISAEAAIPVSLNGGGSVEVTATDPLPVTINGGGELEVTVTNATPIPVSFETAGGMDVNIVNASPVDVNLTNATPIPVSFETAGGMDVTIVNATPLEVTIDGGSMAVTGAVNATIVNASPIEVSFDASGGMDVSLNTLLSGEDQTNNWLETADGATQGQHFIPATTATGGDMPAESVLGTAGAAGDYLKSIRISNINATNAAVYLSQDGAPVVTSGTTGTAPSGTTTCAVTATSAFTASANQYRGRILAVTYIPTGGSTPVKFRRRITAHAAFSAVTALSFTVSHALPAGAAITAWTLEHSSAYELQPYNTPVGMQVIQIGETSTYGGWRLNTDSAVDAHVIGRFS